MAVRLQMNLGLMAESQRLADSADIVTVVEPIIGSTSRTKGSLFLLVTGAGGRKLREATKIVAARIQDDYYYDLSAGISVCLRKAIRAANNVLLHSPDRPQVAPGESGPIGVALAAFSKRLEGERPSALQKHRLIECGQCLQRRVRAGAAHTGEVAIGCVEVLERGVRHRSRGPLRQVTVK